MAREQPEMGWFEDGGVVSHGILGKVNGRRITKPEAEQICAARRAAEPRRETTDELAGLHDEVTRLKAFILNVQGGSNG